MGHTHEQSLGITTTVQPSPSLDETQVWAEEVVRSAKQVFGLYVFDQNRRVHCCEFTPSYECLFVGSAIGNTDLDDDRTPNGSTPHIREGDLGNASR